MKANSAPGSRNGGPVSANGQPNNWTPPANVGSDVESNNLLTALSQDQKTELARCEAVIRQGLETFLDVGRALTTIREKGLYKDKYSTFEDYCRERWEFSKTHANRLIGAAKVVDVLTPNGVTIDSESQIRPLTGLDSDQVQRAWKKVEEMAGGGRITANLVRRAAGEIIGKQSRPAKKGKKARALALLDQLEDAMNKNSMDDAIKLLRRLRQLLSE